VKSLRPSLLALALVAAACGGSDDDDPALVGGVDTSEAGLIAFVKERGYQGWLAEPAIHPGGPHGHVRVFFNDTAVESLRANNATHPKGTILAKEVYASDGTTLTGYAVNVKVREGSGKDTWLFFEGFPPDYKNSFYGRGHEVCHGCHEAGKDYVTSALPQ
jgi:hypothetical protein